ncbi:MAG: hypothetical protein ACOYT4_01620 [Nanoarchaeota archaeon]
MKKYSIMSFPEKEWQDIKAQLRELDHCSTIRSCYELNKYKRGQIFQTPWGDKIRIIKVERYTNPKNIPTWSKLTKGMKISVRMGERYGFFNWDFVMFKKI